tara:strand:+ start:4980 stop:6914 length:1935 start_codon:yes stop_codon:yes gene_type:complete
MAIKRFFCNADNTITNAFKSNLQNRGTGSNMGASDILEVFSILGQESSSSLEQARALLNFPVSDILQERNLGNLPVSGNVKFFLRVFNAPHGQTLPKNFDMAVLPISKSWNEGTGLDMEEYSDEDISNWVFASNTKVPNITDIKFLNATKGNLKHKYISLYDATNRRFNFVFETDGVGHSLALPGREIVIPFTGSITHVRQMARIFSGSIHTGVTGLSASISFEDTTDSTGATVRITTTGSAGQSGSFQGTVNTAHATVTTVQHGGRDRWTTQGGDFHEVGYTAGKNLPHFKQSFVKGTENLEVNITPLVEEWIKGEAGTDPERKNYGVLLKMSGAFDDGSRNRSYYTKKFFSRTTEFFYKRPMIEARWDDSIGDDRNSFYMSSSLMSGEDNLNTLYLYNIVRGQLKNIPVLGANSGSNRGHTTIHLQVFPSGNIKNKVIKAKSLPIGGGVTVNNATVVTGGWVSTGIYSASFAFTGSEKEIFEVWSKPTKRPQGIQLVTGSVFKVKKHSASDYNASGRYVTSITNLKSTYAQSDRARFRLYVRPKDWQPNIYTVASNKAENYTIEDGYYRIFRIIDTLDVISFGTGSGQQGKYTKLSYDKEGNYFDMDMSNFESGYSYGIQFMYDVNGRQVIQDKIFKFRVER